MTRSFLSHRHPRHLLRRQPGAASQAARRLHRPDLHRPAVQLQPQLRGLLGRDEGEARLRGPARQHAGVHRVHAAALRRTGPRAQEDRQLLLPLRLARLPLRQGDARPDFRREQLSERDRLEAEPARTATAKQGVHPANHDTIFFYTGGGGQRTWNRQYTSRTTRSTSIENYRQRTTSDGRRYRVSDLTANEPAATRRKWNPHYEVHVAYKRRIGATPRRRCRSSSSEGASLFRPDRRCPR